MTGLVKMAFIILPYMLSLLSLIRKHLLHPSDLPIFQPNLDPARMEGGGCQDFSNY
jgi:hypothetical protein